MSAATLERERGDDREPEVSVERLQEMYEQPVADEVLYESDKIGVGIGDIALKASGNRYARLRGYAIMQRANPAVSRRYSPPV